MKAQIIYEYELHLFGEDEPIILSQAEGEKLMSVLMEKNPRFVTLRGGMINTKAIRDIKHREKKKVVGKTTQWKDPIHKSVKRELTEKEKEIRSKYEALKGEELPKLKDKND